MNRGQGSYGIELFCILVYLVTANGECLSYEDDSSAMSAMLYHIPVVYHALLCHFQLTLFFSKHVLP